MSGVMTEDELFSLLKDMEAYIMTHYDAITSVADLLFGDNEIKSGTHISKYYNSSMHEMHPILDFLCDKGYLDKVSQSIRLIPKGRMNFEEIAFVKVDK
jgi:hypothetical protein